MCLTSLSGELELAGLADRSSERRGKSSFVLMSAS